MEEKLRELKNRLMEVNDLNSAGAILGWDQATYMPPGGAPARARQMATLGRLAQEKFTDLAIGKLLDDLAGYEASLPYDSDDASLIRVARREYERAIKVPPAFLGELYALGAESYQVWAEARPANDYQKTLPFLEKILDYSRRLANFFPGYEHIADPLIDMADFGMKTKSIKAIFSELRQNLIPLAKAISEKPQIDDSCLRKIYPEPEQLAFALNAAKTIGYDTTRGRQDKTHHPFCTTFSIGDVRITTRVQENYLGEAFFSTIHESGHAVYEQGVNPNFEGTLLQDGTSAGVHESQSRLWENIVGRSRNFWQYYYPKLQDVFPSQLGNVEMETFYRAINKVQPSLIRTDADEVTYNLHVMIRFDFEMQLLEGTLSLNDLPEAWHERYQSDLGVHAPDDRDGVLQDVHWYSGIIGGNFQGYTLGNIMGGLFFAEALKAQPEIPLEISQGKFQNLHNWLIENIYQHGSKFTAGELIRRITGKELTIQPYLQYLTTKYGELYQLS